MFGSKQRRIEALEQGRVMDGRRNKDLLTDLSKTRQEAEALLGQLDTRRMLAEQQTDTIAKLQAERDMGLQRVTELELELADAKRGANEVRRELDDAYKQVGKDSHVDSVVSLDGRHHTTATTPFSPEPGSEAAQRKVPRYEDDTP